MKGEVPEFKGLIHIFINGDSTRRTTLRSRERKGEMHL